jgi:hypothetical protein
MALLQPDGNPNRNLTPEDYTSSGEIKNKSGDLALVVGSAEKAETYLNNKQWNLLWRDADLLYQAPRPMTAYENTYVLEPNVQRFTVAKVCNAVVPKLYKGLFYADPPMILRPRPGTSQNVVDAKTALFSSLLDSSDFKLQTRWGLEQMAHLGTAIWKWGIDFKEIEVEERKATVNSISAGPTEIGLNDIVATEDAPNIVTKKRVIPFPFFEHREISRVLVAPNLEVSDIRKADYVVDLRYMDFYQLTALRDGLKDKDNKLPEGWDFPDDLKTLWMPPAEANFIQTPRVDQTSTVVGAVHHSEDINISISPDLLFKKLEVLEYWDNRRKIVVLARKKVLFTGDNPFKQIPFLSANWWNRRKAFYGMGLGLIVGQNQRVDQGTINAILKILSFGVNPIYLRRRDANAPTQMIRTSLGKILTVDGEPADAYKLLEVPKVPSEVWSALQESEKATESSSGADGMLVQGSTSGPRTSMGRTAGGASILAGASADRLDGPLDNFIEQVFKPFLYILDYLVFHYISDAEIQFIVGEELGKDYKVDLQSFHNSKFEYEVLAGSSLAAKRIMAQSMTLITEIFQNPTIQQNLAEINQEYVDFKPILNMWMEASEWKNRQDIIKKMTPDMIKRMEAKSAAAQSQAKLQSQAQLEEQKFQEKQQLDDQASDNRIKRDIVREAFKTSAMNEAVEGEPADKGIQGEQPLVM